jgi:hypothetical protein
MTHEPYDINTALANYTEEVTLDLFGQPLHVAFYPMRYTGEIVDYCNSDLEKRGLSWLIPQLIASWNVVVDGQPAPLTQEWLRTQPAFFRRKFWEAFNRALAGDADTGEAQGAESSGSPSPEDYEANAPSSGDGSSS